jgi:hypothetical protein
MVVSDRHKRGKPPRDSDTYGEWGSDEPDLVCNECSGVLKVPDRELDEGIPPAMPSSNMSTMEKEVF